MTIRWRVPVLIAALACLAGATASAQDKRTATKPVIGKVSHYTITEWTGLDALKPAYKSLETELEAANPGLDVEVLSDPFMVWLDKYKILLSAGNSPDVVLVGMADFPKLANSGQLLDLTPYFDSATVKDFVPGILKNYLWKGKMFAAPYTMDTRVLYYNKDLFKKAGLDPNKPPKTWAEYLSYAAKLTMDTNGDGKVDTYGHAYSLPIPEFVNAALFLASGSDVIKVDAQGKITPNANTPEFRDYLKLMADLKKYVSPDFVNLDGGAEDQLFVNGKLGMRINGSWMLDQNPAVKNAPWLGQALIPVRKVGDAGGSYGAGFGLGIPVSTKNKDAAIALLKKILTPEMHSRLITNPPPKYANLAVAEWSKDPIHTVELEQFKTTRSSFPNNLYFDKLNEAENKVVVKVILGVLTVDQAVKEFEAAVTKIVSQ